MHLGLTDAAVPTPGEGPGKAEATRQSILEAAARIFRRDGYSTARLIDIAADIGMKAGSLYYHFGSREALVEAVMEVGTRRTHQGVREALDALPAEADALARLEAAIERHLIMVLAQEDIASATIKLIWQTPAAVREKVLAQQRAYGDLWRALLEEARAAGAIRPDLDLSVTRMAIIGSLNWAADWYRPGHLTPEEIARQIASIVIDGLAP
jgi:AcrR family transcriptional regulator